MTGATHAASPLLEDLERSVDDLARSLHQGGREPLVALHATLDVAVIDPRGAFRHLTERQAELTRQLALSGLEVMISRLFPVERR